MWLAGFPPTVEHSCLLGRFIREALCSVERSIRINVTNLMIFAEARRTLTSLMYPNEIKGEPKISPVDLIPIFDIEELAAQDKDFNPCSGPGDWDWDLFLERNAPILFLPFPSR
jgi:hypothetical protein